MLKQRGKPFSKTPQDFDIIHFILVELRVQSQQQQQMQLLNLQGQF